MHKKKQFLAPLFGLVMMAVFLASCAAPGAESGATPTTGATSPSQVAEMPDTGAMSFDQSFIDMMVPHHQGAVEMAMIAQERAEHAEIKAMADAIVASQEEEINQMKGWRQEWFGSSDTPSMSEMPSLEEMPGMGGAGHAMDMQAEVDQLRDAAEPFDLAFIDAMIPHHQSAIDAAQRAVNEAQQPEIKALAQLIIEAQQREIDQLKSWRDAWYPDAPAPSPH